MEAIRRTVMHGSSAVPTIVAVDDDLAVHEALVARLEPAGLRVHAFASGVEFVRVAGHIRADCVLLSLSLPHLSGWDVLKAIGGKHYPAPVILTGSGSIPTAVAAIKAGAYDFIEKPFDLDAVVVRLQELVRSRSQAPGVRELNFPGKEELTSRELDVLEQVMSGRSNKEAGRILGISPRTVEVHRGRVMAKLGARNTASLMRIVLPPNNHT